MGKNMVIAMIIAYVIIGITFLLQKDYPRAVYWLGAILLNIAVLTMK